MATVQFSLDMQDGPYDEDPVLMSDEEAEVRVWAG